MRGVNKVILVGALGRDPESKTFDNGGSLCNFSIATSESWNDKNTGERQEITEWHRIVVNGKLAGVCQQYLKKGSKVYIEGSLRTRKWTDKDGQERYQTEIRADSMQMLGDKGDSSNSNAQGDQYNNNSGNQSQQRGNGQQAQNNGGYGGNQGYGQQNNQQQSNYGSNPNQGGNKSPNGYTYNQGIGGNGQQQNQNDLDDDLPF